MNRLLSNAQYAPGREVSPCSLFALSRTLHATGDEPHGEMQNLLYGNLIERRFESLQPGERLHHVLRLNLHPYYVYSLS
jgi:hypothetical protein